MGTQEIDAYKWKEQEIVEDQTKHSKSTRKIVQKKLKRPNDTSQIWYATSN